MPVQTNADADPAHGGRLPSEAARVHTAQVTVCAAEIALTAQHIQIKGSVAESDVQGQEDVGCVLVVALRKPHAARPVEAHAVRPQRSHVWQLHATHGRQCTSHCAVRDLCKHARVLPRRRVPPLCLQQPENHGTCLLAEVHWGERRHRRRHTFHRTWWLVPAVIGQVRARQHTPVGLPQQIGDVEHHPVDVDSPLFEDVVVTDAHSHGAVGRRDAGRAEHLAPVRGSIRRSRPARLLAHKDALSEVHRGKSVVPWHMLAVEPVVKPDEVARVESLDRVVHEVPLEEGLHHGFPRLPIVAVQVLGEDQIHPLDNGLALRRGEPMRQRLVAGNRCLARKQPRRVVDKKRRRVGETLCLARGPTPAWLVGSGVEHCGQRVRLVIEGNTVDIHEPKLGEHRQLVVHHPFSHVLPPSPDAVHVAHCDTGPRRAPVCCRADKAGTGVRAAEDVWHHCLVPIHVVAHAECVGHVDAQVRESPLGRPNQLLKCLHAHEPAPKVADRCPAFVEVLVQAPIDGLRRLIW
mmetsp:Transcript_52793/g.122890  ORF Transcript_52793/g.122890 Transcript_52793/m.122890 type:complete len:520 (-) Transcript_52793:198-1757(-)